jgi:hypothetical protein
VDLSKAKQLGMPAEEIIDPATWQEEEAGRLNGTLLETDETTEE